MTFERLNPDNKIELGTYETILDEAMDDDEVCNIALTGGYGAGKSSVMCSYEELHRDKKFIHVSLTHFTANQEDGEENDSATTTENEQLVGRIINQLVHQMRMEDIPQTRFLIKELVTRKRIFGYTAAVLGIILPFFYWTNYSKASFLAICLKSDFLKGCFGKPGLAIVAIIFAISLAYLAYRIVRRQLLHPFITQFHFKDSSIPMNQIENDKNFDKYLDEIIYLFQKSNVYGVVFDDLDRFDDNGIFVKLREMNYLINKRRNPYYPDRKLTKERKKNQKKWEKAKENGTVETFEPEKISNKVKFLYLLRDDMFEAGDRTKFFDLIIPVVPVVDASNSYDKFIEIFKQHDFFLKNEERSFLKKVSVYIDDMRIIKNIYNEFRIYSSRLMERYELGLERCNILGYICYKNLFPKDFLALQHEEGFLWKVIRGRERIVEYRMQEYREEKNQLEVELEQLRSRIEQERCEDEEQLLVDLFPADNYVIDGKQASSFSNFDELVRAALKEESVEVGKIIRGSYYGNRWETERISIDDIVEDIKASEEYQRRIVLIGPNSQTASRMRELQEKIAELDVKIADAVNASAEELYGDKDVFYLFSSDERNQYSNYINHPKIELVSFLVKEGIIDEGYHDYITYFYGVSQSVADKNFVLNFNARRVNDWDMFLDNPVNILQNYSVEECQRISALNYCFLSAALEVDVEKASAILQCVHENREYAFVKDAFSKCRTDDLRATLVEVLKSVWPEIVMESPDNGTMLQIVSMIAMYGQGNTRQFNISHVICDTVKNCIDEIGLQYVSSDVRSNMIRNLQSWETEFVDFSGRLDDEVRATVLKAGLFALNSHMVGEYFRLIRQEEMEPETLLTQCMACKDVLSDKIKEKSDEFYEFTLERQNSLKDEEDVFLEYYEGLGEKNKVSILGKWDNKVRDIRGVDQEKWVELYESGAVVCSINNILCYFRFCEKELDDVLMNFLNENAYANISLEEKATDKDLLELRMDLFNKVVIGNQLTNAAYRWLVQGLNFCYKKGFSVEGIDADKVDILIEEHVIHMTNGCLEGLRSVYPNHVSHFIAQNVAEYEKIIADSETENFGDEIRKVIESGELKEREIRKLLSHYDGAIRLNKKWTNSLQCEIVRNHLDDKDYKLLVQNYDAQKENIQEVIVDNLKLYAPDIAGYEFKICDNVLNRLLGNRNIPEDVRKSVYIGQVSYMNAQMAREYLNLTVETEREAWLKIIREKQARVEATELNKEILTRLQRKKMISSYKYDEKTDMYWVYMPRKKVNDEKRQ